MPVGTAVIEKIMGVPQVPVLRISGTKPRGKWRPGSILRCPRVEKLNISLSVISSTSQSMKDSSTLSFRMRSQCTGVCVSYTWTMSPLQLGMIEHRTPIHRWTVFNFKLIFGMLRLCYNGCAHLELFAKP